MIQRWASVRWGVCPSQNVRSQLYERNLNETYLTFSPLSQYVTYFTSLVYLRWVQARQYPVKPDSVQLVAEHTATIFIWDANYVPLEVCEHAW